MAKNGMQRTALPAEANAEPINRKAAEWKRGKTHLSLNKSSSSLKESKRPMQNTYYKLVALERPTWLQAEFLAGRARFGWSGRDADLHTIRAIPPADRSTDQRVTWRYTQFLIQRLRVGDRIVYQFDQPLREFLIGEVIQPGYASDRTLLSDFNHILHVRPLTPQPIPIAAEAISAAVRHNLTKRGHYYRIYSALTCRALDDLVTQAESGFVGQGQRSRTQDFAETEESVRRGVLSEISARWPAKYFESFSAWLLGTLDHIEVNRVRDSGEGWDIQIRVLDPVSQEILHDDVPVQCKNYKGAVEDSRPIEDLARSIRNSGAGLAYLLILGDITPQFRHQLEQQQEELELERGHSVRLVLVDQDAIADMYIKAIALGHEFDEAELGP